MHNALPAEPAFLGTTAIAKLVRTSDLLSREMAVNQLSRRLPNQ